MAKRKVTIFYAWQSDRPQSINRHFIRKALNVAAKRLNDDATIRAEIVVDADTEGVVGTPPVTETILKKIREADIFVPDLTFVAETEDGKLVPNPNVMAEYGYALRSLTVEAMMPVMNIHYGAPSELPFDLGHLRYPTQYNLQSNVPDAERRAARNKLSEKLEDILRLMIQNALSKSQSQNRFVAAEAVRPPAFFFHPNDVIANFGYPGEQELRFKRDRAIYLRIYPSYSDQPYIGLTRAIQVAQKLMPLQRIVSSPSTQNEWGAVNICPHGDGITSFTQLFETGELWGVSEEPFRHGNALVAIGVEKTFVAALENYRVIYERELKLLPPFTIEFGATGLKDICLLVPSAELPGVGDSAGRIRKPYLRYTAKVSGFDQREWQSALREFLIRLYDLAARDRSNVLTDEIVAANGIPPR